MKQIVSILAAMACLTLHSPAGAAQKTSPGTAAKTETEPVNVSKAERSVTQHKIVIGGATVNYRATAGALIVRDGKDQPYASIGYFAYVKNDVADPSRRPITFAYNGGPGSASIWLHMGALGPKRVVTADASRTLPPPYRIIDNESSVLDKTDLVMIDPVGTGFSRAVGEAKEKEFWGVDPDIESISRFIKQYITENGRWNSPKYLLGESYGTTRSAGIVDYLQTREAMVMNGIVLVSLATDLDVILDSLRDEGARYHEITFPLYLPSYAAVAWYHKLLPDRPAELGPFLDEVRVFALGEYAHALILGSGLPDAARTAIIGRLHRYTGLSPEYLDRADLRVGLMQFVKELLRERRESVGILDARFLGVSLDPLGEQAEYDPMMAATDPPFVAAFRDYLHRDLNFAPDRAYVPLSDEAYEAWDFRHKAPGSKVPQPMVNTGVDLAHAMGVNSDLRVLVLQGIFDPATPLLATEYMVSHLDLRKDLRSHVEIKYYEAGHAMYLHEPSLRKFKSDVAAFIDATSHF